MKIIIDRATWCAGEHKGRDISALLRNDGKRCCLGFLGQACKVPDEYMRGVSFPSLTGLPHEWPSALTKPGAWATNYLSTPERWELVLAMMNDAKSVPDAIREEWIATGFRVVLDAEVEFVGDYPAGA